MRLSGDLLPTSRRHPRSEYPVPNTPLRNGLWHPLNIPLPRAPSERELQHGYGPAGCAVLLKARFDRRLDYRPGGGLGGEEGCAADRASSMREPPLGGGSGERHVQKMPEPRRRDLLNSDLPGPGGCDRLGRPGGRGWPSDPAGVGRRLEVALSGANGKDIAADPVRGWVGLNG